jgi:hypothetical protein
VAKRRKRASRRASERPERGQDPRLAAAEVVEDVDQGLKQGDWVVGVSPVNLVDGRTLIWPSPQPIAFNLVEAKRAVRRGARERFKIMSQLKCREGDARYSPPFRRETIDAIGDLQVAVLGSFTAIESFANHAIDRLIEVKDEDVEVKREDGQMVSGESLVRRLRLEEKFKLIFPLLEGGRNIAGTAAWEDFRYLKLLRDELVHVKKRGVNSDPDTPTAYDRLMLGDGDDCVERAIHIIDGAWQDFLPPLTRTALE